jgi:hypothetical protein
LSRKIAEQFAEVRLRQLAEFAAGSLVWKSICRLPL